MLIRSPIVRVCRNVLATVAVFSLPPVVWAQPSSETGSQAESEPREPTSITLILMDLTGAEDLLDAHDLDDNRALNETEFQRLKWSPDEIRRFDLDRDGVLQHLELALKLADARIENGIVQMDSVLADRYTKRYDANRDGKLSMEELERNDFTDSQSEFDTNSDGELTDAELIRGLAFERKLRDLLGIKGCDQGGAMKLIGRGDRSGDRQIDAEELDGAGLNSDAMKFDRNGNGRLSVSELAECLAARRLRLGLNPSDQLAVRSIIRGLDRDASGTLSVAELERSRNAEILADADVNGDGESSELEIEQAFGKRRRELGYNDQDFERASKLVKRNDSDGSRSLSRPELVASGADRSSPLSPEKLPAIDTDRDGKISVEELARFLKKSR